MILSEAAAGHGKGPQRARDPKKLLPGHGNPLERARQPLPQRKFVEANRHFVERAGFLSKGTGAPVESSLTRDACRGSFAAENKTNAI